MNNMVFHSISEYIIPKYRNKFSENWREHINNKALECGGVICYAKWHNKKFIVTIEGNHMGARNW